VCCVLRKVGRVMRWCFPGSLWWITDRGERQGHYTESKERRITRPRKAAGTDEATLPAETRRCVRLSMTGTRKRRHAVEKTKFIYDEKLAGSYRSQRVTISDVWLARRAYVVLRRSVQRTTLWCPQRLQPSIAI